MREGEKCSAVGLIYVAAPSFLPSSLPAWRSGSGPGRAGVGPLRVIFGVADGQQQQLKEKEAPFVVPMSKDRLQRALLTNLAVAELLRIFWRRTAPPRLHQSRPRVVGE